MLHKNKDGCLAKDYFDKSLRTLIINRIDDDIIEHVSKELDDIEFTTLNEFKRPLSYDHYVINNVFSITNSHTALLVQLPSIELP